MTMNTKAIIKNGDDYQSLYEQLEKRYGPALAQTILDEIKKADDQSYVPDYMSVKMLSEVLESMEPDWIGYYGIIKRSYHVLYKRAMDAFEIPAYRTDKQKQPERMTA